MDKRYRIGEVVKDMGVGQYTLKHYQKAGLIEPQVDPDSGYRFYTYIDYGKLIQVRNLRAMGMAVESVSETMQATSEQALERYKAQAAENEAQIARLARANELIAARTASLERYVRNKGTWLVEEASCPLHFIKHFDDDVIDAQAKDLTSQSPWLDVYEQADIAFVVRQDALASSEGAKLEWGVLLYRADEVPESMSALVEPVAQGKVLVAFMEVDRMRMQETAVEPLRGAIRDAGVSVRGDAVAVMNDLTVEDDRMTMAVTALVPVA